MRIAVTGSSGSIGRVLNDAIARNGQTPIPFPSRAQLDLANPSAPLKEWLAVNQPDAIVHLAGWRLGGDVAAAIRDNVTATFNLVSAVASAQLRPRIVVASSAAVYGEGHGRMPLSVDAERRPLNVYGFSKALQEDVCTLFRAGNDLDISIARIFNLFGVPGERWSVIPSLIDRIGRAGARDVIHVANARCTRDFVHVDDVCGALILAATRPNAPIAFNVATGIGTPIAQLARRIADDLDRDVDLRFSDVVDPGTIADSSGDPAETLAMGWSYRSISDRELASSRACETT